MKIKLFGTLAEIQGDKITAPPLIKGLIEDALELANATPDQGNAQIAKIENYWGQDNVEIIEHDPAEPGEQIIY